MTDVLYPTPGFSNDHGVGSGETAFFVATGPVYVSDSNGAAGNLVFEADPRHGDLPSWASLDAGNVSLGEDAGTVAYSLRAAFIFDFSATTPPDSGGNIQTYIGVSIDGTNFNLDGGVDQGNGMDVQTSSVGSLGGVRALRSVSAQGFPAATSDGSTYITNGTATPRVALTVTRIAQSAVLPD